jgi:hypothetical protein
VRNNEKKNASDIKIVSGGRGKNGAPHSHPRPARHAFIDAGNDIEIREKFIGYIFFALLIWSAN